VKPSRRSLGGFLPDVFTQEGVAILSSVLNSERAVQVNIAIMRAFVQPRQFAASHKDLAKKIDALEHKCSEHDDEIQVIFKAIKKLLEPPQARPSAASASRPASNFGGRNLRPSKSTLMIHTTFTPKQETLFVAYAPEFDVSAYGGFTTSGSRPVRPL